MNAAENITSFGYWVRRQRKALDLTQADLAGRAACTVSMIKKIEQDERRPSPDLAIILADQLALPPAHRENFIQMARGKFVDAPLSAVSPPMPPTRPRPLFVMREQELDSLTMQLKKAVDGNGRTLFITGEAGQGKTSLMAEFAFRAQTAYPSLAIAAGTCQALTGIADPYLPFRDLLAMLSGDWQRPWLGSGMPPELIQRLQTIAPQTIQAIAAYAPNLADIIVPAAFLSQQGDSQPAAINQRQIFAQTTQLLRTLAQERPLLLLLDDLQWIDTASANLLFHLARQLTNAPILFVGAFRPSETNFSRQISHPLATVVKELVRYQGDIQVNLDTFKPQEGRSFVDALIDSSANHLGAGFREALFWRTKGHPLFTVELLKALRDQGDLVKDESGAWTAVPSLNWGILPARIEAVIARRIESIPPELSQLLSVASVEGETFTVEALAQVESTEVRPLLQKLSQELDKQYGLIWEQAPLRLGQTEIGRFQFRHNLFQQYLYHRLSKTERRYLHSQIAAILAQLSSEDPAQLAVSIASHYLAAGKTAEAVPYLHLAGDEARRRVALEEAIEFYQSALQHWHTDDATTQADLLYKLGDCYLILAKYQEANSCFKKAEKLYSQTNNQIGRGAMQRLIGRTYWEQGKRAEATQHYDQALTILRNTESPELARAISAISQMHMLADQNEQAIVWGERALDLARRLDVKDVIVHSLNNVGTALVIVGRPDQGLAMLAESQEQAEALGLPHDSCRAFVNWGESLVMLERLDEARALFERLLSYARQVQAEMFEGVALFLLAHLDWRSGQWQKTLSQLPELQQWMSVSAFTSIPKIWAVTLLGEIYNDLGQPGKARMILLESAEIARSANELQTTVPFLGELARTAESEIEFMALAEEILALFDGAITKRLHVLPAIRLVCVRMLKGFRGDPSGLERLEKAYKQFPGLEPAASLHECRGVAAAMRGEWAVARAEYAIAAEKWESLGRPYDLLRLYGHWSDALSVRDSATQTVRDRAGALAEQLSAELTDPDLKRSFLNSPQVAKIMPAV